MPSQTPAGQRFRRGRRRLPERVTRLRWLRDAGSDPPGCERRTVVDEATVTAQPAGAGRVELRIEQHHRAKRLADEFFGGRYDAREEAAGVVFIGQPL